MIYHHLAKFGGHSAVVEMFLVCHVIKEDNLNKGSGGYNDRSPSK